jgi:hypothetical protein
MNYFNYFTEIETRFQQRRGNILMLSTLDWALIETWREAGIPLEAVLRGIDAAFDKHDAQKLRAGGRRVRKVNGLAWCAQAVLEAVELSRNAATGAAPGNSAEARASGFESARVACYLEHNAVQLTASAAKLPPTASTAANETAARLRELAASLSLLSSRSASEGSASLSSPVMSLETLDRTLTVLEEKLFAALLTATPEAELVALREQAARELAPYRGKMQAVQIKQVQQQFLQKRLLEAHSLPRLSLFYMPLDTQHDDLA